MHIVGKIKRVLNNPIITQNYMTSGNMKGKYVKLEWISKKKHVNVDTMSRKNFMKNTL